MRVRLEELVGLTVGREGSCLLRAMWSVGQWALWESDLEGGVWGYAGLREVQASLSRLHGGPTCLGAHGEAGHREFTDYFRSCEDT